MCCSAPIIVTDRLERHSSECGRQREIEKIYGGYKMFDLARKLILEMRTGRIGSKLRSIF
jgi:hypothetical protein